jgi:hypothetical protein
MRTGDLPWGGGSVARGKHRGVLERPRDGADADADTLATGHEAVAQPSAA